VPNPYVTSVDRDAFWNQFRSTPEPALMMVRPPALIDPTLYRDRWPSTGPYAGQSAPPYAYSQEERQTPPIMEPLPEGMLPTAPRDVQIEGLGYAYDDVPSWMRLLFLASGVAAAYHGYKRNDDSIGWGLMWGVGSSVFGPLGTGAALVFAWDQGYAQPAGMTRMARGSWR